MRVVDLEEDIALFGLDVVVLDEVVDGGIEIRRIEPLFFLIGAIFLTLLFLFLIVLAVLDARGLGNSPLISLTVLVGMIVMNVVPYLALPALVTPIIFQSFVAPLRPASVTDAWTAVRRRWKTLGAATAWSLRSPWPGRCY